MHSSYGPQVDLSSSARFNYEDPILRSITDLSNCISTLGTQQQQMQDTMAHNTQLTQESWGLTSALQYDVLNVFIHLGRISSTSHLGLRVDNYKLQGFFCKTAAANQYVWIWTAGSVSKG